MDSNTGKILKQFRKNRNLSQIEVATGIISRQAYSKIERGISEPNYDIFQSILNRLNYNMTDFLNENNNQSGENSYYKLLLKGLDNTLTSQEAETLYNYVNNNKSSNSKIMHLYGRVIGHLHHKFPAIIPYFSQDDKDLFKKYIFHLKGHYSLNDLQIIGDFATISMDKEELCKFYEQLPDFSTSDYAFDITSYQIQINKIYNNFCDVFLANNNLIHAADSIKKQKKFLAVRMDLRYAFYLKINEIALTFKQTKNERVLLELLNIADTMESVGDKSTAKAIRYQYKTYIDASPYLPENALTPDK
ncbi:hypothetical protein A5881_003899 [Enterococcus termitis]|nr:hypothetical protein A5881_003919 [Enterococcus termitis]